MALCLTLNNAGTILMHSLSIVCFIHTERFHLQIILKIEKNKTATDHHMFVHHSCFSSKIVIIRLDYGV